MIKRISCRVVKSTPLGKRSGLLWYENPSNNKHHKYSDASTDKFAPRNNSVVYIDQVDITAGSPPAQFFDCYA